jgi:hypothetical protein
MKCFIPPSILNDTLRFELFSFSTQGTSLHAILALKVSVENSAVILKDLLLHVI